MLTSLEDFVAVELAVVGGESETRPADSRAVGVDGRKKAIMME